MVLLFVNDHESSSLPVRKVSPQSYIVDLRHAFRSLSWLFALSFSHVVIGRVHAIRSNVLMLGNESS